MFRLVFAILVGIAILYAGSVILDPEPHTLGWLAFGTFAMLVTGFLAPHVFIRGDWPPPRRRRSD
jgi:hypothetical protein